jgi:hypothetical protein
MRTATADVRGRSLVEFALGRDVVAVWKGRVVV